jgi:SAM-dependent methyltransferase
MEAELLAQQVAYYRARASEYDDWFKGRGRYDKGPDHARRWTAEVETVRAELERTDLGQSVLEFAAGTGWWTSELAGRAASLTAVDSSPEVLSRNRSRVGDASVEYVHADIFDWRPTRRFDSVFFSFWLSHVPPTQFDEFWDLVVQSVQPEGTIFFVDSRRHPDYQWSDGRKARTGVGPSEHQVTRELNDGRVFDIVKVFYEPTALEQRLKRHGLTGAISETPEFFLWGRLKSSWTRTGVKGAPSLTTGSVAAPR